MSRSHAMARLVRRWHARLGVAAAMFFILLVLTGVALNHTERLGLGQVAVQSASLARWYGLPPPQVLAAYQADGLFLNTPDTWLYRGKRLPEGRGAVTGVVRIAELLAVATAQSLTLYTPQGERIDTLRGDALPAQPITALGRAGQAIAVKTAQGAFVSADGIAWQAITTHGITWSHAAPFDIRRHETMISSLTPSLPLERIMFDLHSGRLFGRYGTLIMDAAAIILLGLSLSGAWIQWRSWLQRRRHPHSGKA